MSETEPRLPQKRSRSQTKPTAPRQSPSSAQSTAPATVNFTPPNYGYNYGPWGYPPPLHGYPFQYPQHYSHYPPPNHSSPFSAPTRPDQSTATPPTYCVDQQPPQHFAPQPPPLPLSHLCLAAVRGPIAQLPSPMGQLPAMLKEHPHAGTGQPVWGHHHSLKPNPMSGRCKKPCTRLSSFLPPSQFLQPPHGKYQPHRWSALSSTQGHRRALRPVNPGNSARPGQPSPQKPSRTCNAN